MVENLFQNLYRWKLNIKLNMVKMNNNYKIKNKIWQKIFLICYYYLLITSSSKKF